MDARHGQGTLQVGRQENARDDPEPRPWRHDRGRQGASGPVTLRRARPRLGRPVGLVEAPPGSARAFPR